MSYFTLKSQSELLSFFSPIACMLSWGLGVLHGEGFLDAVSLG